MTYSSVKRVEGVPNLPEELNGWYNDPTIKIIAQIDEPAEGRAEYGDYVTIIYEEVRKHED